MTSKKQSSEGMIDWACEMESKVYFGCYPGERSPMVFNHWIAFVIVFDRTGLG